MSCCTLFNYPIDEMPQKNSGLHDAKDRRLTIYNEINNWSLKTLIPARMLRESTREINFHT